MRFTVGALMLCAAFSASGANIVQDYNFNTEPRDDQSVSSGQFSPGSPWYVNTVSAVFGIARVQLPSALGGPIDPNAGAVDEAAWFFEDQGLDTLYQTLPVIGGVTYDVSFDVMQTYLGSFYSIHPGFTVTLGSTQIANFTVGSLPVPSSPADTSAWVHKSYSASYTAPSTGNVILSFAFAPPATYSGPANDMLLDLVNVSPEGAPSVPEPGSAALLLPGAALVYCKLRRRI